MFIFQQLTNVAIRELLKYINKFTAVRIHTYVMSSPEDAGGNDDYCNNTLYITYCE
jgi:hypothetical protein